MGQIWGIRDKGTQRKFQIYEDWEFNFYATFCEEKCLKSSYSEKIIKKGRGESKMKKPWDPRNSRQSKEVLR